MKRQIEVDDNLDELVEEVQEGIRKEENNGN